LPTPTGGWHIKKRKILATLQLGPFNHAKFGTSQNAENPRLGINYGAEKNTDS